MLSSPLLSSPLLILATTACALAAGAVFAALRLRAAGGAYGREGRDDRQGLAERLAGLGSWVHDLADNRLHWSAGSFRLFGIDPMAGEPPAKAFVSAILAVDRQRWRDALRDAVREGREMKLEFGFKRPDGSKIWVRTALRPERVGGRVVRMSGIVQDISGMRAMQRQLAASETKFRELTQLSSDWIWETDAQHRITHLSESVDSVLGPWFRACVGRRPWENGEADFLSPDWALYRSLVRAHKPIDDFELSRIDPGGTVHHLSLNGRPVFDRSGMLTAYRGTGRDITREREQRLLLELEGDIASIIRDYGDADRTIRAIIAALCERLGWLGGMHLSRGADGGAPRAGAEPVLRVREREGSAPFLQMAGSLPDPLTLEADSPELLCLASGEHAWLASLEPAPTLAQRYRARALGARAALVVPINDGRQRAGSVLVLLSPAGFRGTSFVGQLADTLSRTLSLYLRRARAEQQLRHASMHDALTGLPNRSQLQRALERRLATGIPLALLYIDLDRYKIINDTLGHAAGDQALIEIARRLRSAIRRQDLVARMGGDEFVVLLIGIDVRDEIEAIARKLLAAVERPLMLGQRAWFLSASIGVTVAPDDSREAASLIKGADAAMYEVKTEGRNDVRFFSGELSEERSEQLELAAELPLALERNELALHYQPVMAIGDRRVVCLEALLRWRHPKRGLLGPERFLPAAEQSQLARELGLWTLRQALDDRVRLGIARHPEIAVAVNVSGRQLIDDSFVATLGRLLAERQVPAHLLRIELTESTFVEHAERTAELIARLRKLGVRVIIDNFGTGYASLSYLRNLPVDGLKIDRTFVHGLPDDRGNAAIVQAITTMAARLGLQAMAEGVDTAGELHGLRTLGCDQVQGALIAEVMNIDETEEFLETLPRLRRMHLPA